MNFRTRNICLLIAVLSISSFATPSSAESNSSLAEAQPVKCGERLTKPLFPTKILIDTGSEIEQWPWVGALYISADGSPPDFRCVVTILNDRFVVVAGYCVRAVKSTPSVLSVRLGTAHLNEDDGESLQTFNVEEILMSPNGDRYATIALLKLSSKIVYSQFVHSICLKDVRPEVNIVGSNGFTVGWESDWRNVNEQYMREVSVSLVPNSSCVTPGLRGITMDDKLCARVVKSRPKDVIATHVGGLYLEDNRIWFMKGVGIGDVMNGELLIFSDIAPHLPWIKQTVG